MVQLIRRVTRSMSLYYCHPRSRRSRWRWRRFIISGELKSVATPIRARRERNREKDGRFLATFLVKRPNAAELIRFPAVIPYADLDIPVGTHQIAYEVRGLRDGKLEFVQPTALSLVTVANETRREMEQRELITDTTAKTRAMTILLGGERTRGGGPTPTKQQEIQVTEALPEIKSRVRKLAVNIPGAFRRAELPEEPAADPSEPIRAPTRPLSDIRPASERIVYFATNRARLDRATTPPSPFGNKMAEDVTWGQCVVNIPVQRHKTGTLEEPNWWRNPDPKRDFLVESVQILSRAQFRTEMQDSDLLLFIHGYKYTFDGAVLQCAQIQYDLEFSGRPIAFAWPSTGELTGYERDAQQATFQRRCFDDRPSRPDFGAR